MICAPTRRNIHGQCRLSDPNTGESGHTHGRAVRSSGGSENATAWLREIDLSSGKLIQPSQLVLSGLE